MLVVVVMSLDTLRVGGFAVIPSCIAFEKVGFSKDIFGGNWELMLFL